jgi:hypothetical protein
LGSFCEKTARSLLDTIMGEALAYVNLSKNTLALNEC